MTRKNRDLAASMNPLQSLAAIGLVFVLGLIYAYGMMLVVRNNLLIEIALVVILPIVLIASGVAGSWIERVKELFFIESVFNLVVIGSLISIYMGSPTGNRIFSWGFVLFFLAQAGGFIREQILRRKFHGALQSTAFLILLGVWWLGIDDPSGVIDVNGRFLMWGQDAPVAVKLFYTLWAVNGILVDTKALPNLTQATLHLASIALCWWSGEFFHVRLLTASHLFLLDGVFGYSGSGAFSEAFCAVPKPWQATFEQKAKPAIAYLSSLSVIIIIILSFFGGLDLRFQ